MNKKLFVGSIAYATTDDSLRNAFEQSGEVVSAEVVIGPDGRSKGFGFVVMATEEGAEKAIADWNGKQLDGREIIVNESRPREDRPQRSGGFRGGNNNRYGGGGGYQYNR